MAINASKTKEMQIIFNKTKFEDSPVMINGETIETVTSTKLVGVTNQDNLKWNEHVNLKNQHQHVLSKTT